MKITSEKMQCSIQFSETIKMVKSTVTVKSNVFYQTKYYETEKKSKCKVKTDEVKTDRKRQKTSNDADQSESQLSIKCSVSLKTNFSDKNVSAKCKNIKPSVSSEQLSKDKVNKKSNSKTTTGNRKNITPAVPCDQSPKFNIKSNSSTETKTEEVVYLPLVRCNGFIGPDQYREGMKTIVNEAIRAANINGGTKMEDRQARIQKQKLSTIDASGKKSTNKNSMMRYD